MRIGVSSEGDGGWPLALLHGERQRNPNREGRLLWLINRKRPGKICRGRQFRRFGGWLPRVLLQILLSEINKLRQKHALARRSHNECWIVVMGVAGGPSEDLSGEQRMPSLPSIRFYQATCAALLALLLSAVSAQATSRIKDLANIEGVRQNQLIGYGLVVGLNGTGDTLNNIPFTKQSLQAMLERMGVNIRGQTIRTGNVAAVMVTGNLPAFGTQGTRMDVTVSALGDAKNLTGGTLLVTPLLGADGNVYAVAQGSLTINGFAAEGAAASITRGVPTVGRIANGAIIEREVEFALNRMPNVRLALRNPDFTTAKRIAAAVNDFLGSKTAEPLDPSTVQMSIPPEFKGNVVALLTEIEQLQVEPDLSAKIIIDERSGIIVMGRDVRVATVAVAQGNLTVTISESANVSQPNAASNGRTVVTPTSKVGVTEDGKKFALVKDGVSLQQLVDGLNGLGIGPRDLIGILQAIKAAGAIQADIEVM
jgi:flagellar P-ring protein precursor FlgI